MFFEGSAWDLKIVFGSVDQITGSKPRHTTYSHFIVLGSSKSLRFFCDSILSRTKQEWEESMYYLELCPHFQAEPPADIKALLGTGTDLDSYHKARKLYEQFIAENPEAEPSEEKKNSKTSSMQ